MNEVNDLTLSESDSDSDFIQAKKTIHPFLYQASGCYIKFLYIKFMCIKFVCIKFVCIKFILRHVLTTEIISHDACMNVVYCSLAKLVIHQDYTKHHARLFTTVRGSVQQTNTIINCDRQNNVFKLQFPVKITWYVMST